MQSKWINNVLAGLENPPEYVEKGTTDEVELKFENAYRLQEFVLAIRRQGVRYGMELAELDIRRAGQ